MEPDKDYLTLGDNELGSAEKLESWSLRNSFAASGDVATMKCFCPSWIDMRGP